MDDEQARWEKMHDELVFGRLRVLRLADILKSEPRDYLLKGLMSPAEMSVWVGAPKCGKSFLMLHIAYAIAQGRNVFEKRVKPVPVLYVAAEGEAGIANRLRAIQTGYGEAENFYLIAQPADLLHEHGDQTHLEMAAAKIGARLIVVDTLSRVMAGGDENGPQDMGAFISNMGDLRQNTGAHVAIVHHGTKASDGRAPRGHSSLIGAADAVIEVAKSEEGSRTATVVMAKDDPDGAAMGFGLRVVELGTDADGDPITTCAVDELDMPAKSQGPKLTPTEKTATRFLADLVAVQGAPLPAGPHFPVGLLGVPEAAWRDACDGRRLSTAETPKDRGRVFRATYTTLRGKGIIGTAEGIVWLTSSQGIAPCSQGIAP